MAFFKSFIIRATIATIILSQSYLNILFFQNTRHIVKSLEKETATALSKPTDDLDSNNHFDTRSNVISEERKATTTEDDINNWKEKSKDVFLADFNNDVEGVLNYMKYIRMEIVSRNSKYEDFMEDMYAALLTTHDPAFQAFLLEERNEARAYLQDNPNANMEELMKQKEYTIHKFLELQKLEEFKTNDPTDSKYASLLETLASMENNIATSATVSATKPMVDSPSQPEEMQTRRRPQHNKQDKPKPNRIVTNIKDKQSDNPVVTAKDRSETSKRNTVKRDANGSGLNVLKNENILPAKKPIEGKMQGRIGRNSVISKRNIDTKSQQEQAKKNQRVGGTQLTKRNKSQSTQASAQVASSPSLTMLKPPFRIFQNGEPRTGSTFQFHLLDSIVHLKSPDDVDIEVHSITVDKWDEHDIQRLIDEDKSFIFKVHKVYPKVEEWHRNGDVAVFSSGDRAPYARYNQQADRLAECSLCEVDQYAAHFGLTKEEVEIVKNFMGMFEKIRQCCGLQMSKYNVMRLNGCDVSPFQDEPSYPHCEDFDMTEIEKEFAKSPIPYHPSDTEFNWMQEGDCGMFDKIVKSGYGFNGKKFMGCEDYLSNPVCKGRNPEFNRYGAIENTVEDTK